MFWPLMKPDAQASSGIVNTRGKNGSGLKLFVDSINHPTRKKQQSLTANHSSSHDVTLSAPPKINQDIWIPHEQIMILRSIIQGPSLTRHNPNSPRPLPAPAPEKSRLHRLPPAQAEVNPWYSGATQE